MPTPHQSPAPRQPSGGRKARASAAERIGELQAEANLVINDDPHRALAIGSEIVDLAESSANETAMAFGWRVMGSSHIDLGNYADAQDLLDRAIAVQVRIGDRVGLARSLDNRAGLSFVRGDPDALDRFRTALSAVAETGDERRYAITNGNMVGALHRHGELNEALARAAASRATFEELGDERMVAWTQGIQANLLISLGRTDEAIDVGLRALGTFESLDCTHDAAVVANNLAVVYRLRGELVDATRMYNIARSRYEQSGDKMGVALVTGNMGHSYFEMGDYGNALDHYQIALTQSEEIGAIDVATSNIYSIGNLYECLDDFDSALEAYTRGLDRAMSFDNAGLQAKITMSIGSLYRGHGDAEQALDYLVRALNAWQNIGDRGEIAICMINLGYCYRDLSKYAESLDLLEAARELCVELHMRLGEARALLGLGQIFRSTDLWDAGAAERNLLRSLEIATELDAQPLLLHIHRELSELYKTVGRWEESYAHLSHCVEIDQEIHSRGVLKKTALHEADLRIEEVQRRSGAQRAAEEARRKSLEARVEHQRAELTAAAAEQARRTETLHRFRSDLTKILGETAKAEVAILAIKKHLQSLPLAMPDRARLMAELQEMHSGFLAALQLRFPALTRTESRICSLVRLRLVSADIAEVLCLSERTVECHRRSIRRKFALTREQDLTAFLAEL